MRRFLLNFFCFIFFACCEQGLTWAEDKDLLEGPGFDNFHLRTKTEATHNDNLEFTAEHETGGAGSAHKFSSSQTDYTQSSFTIKHGSGLKITVFNREDSFALRNILHARTNISASAQGNAQINAEAQAGAQYSYTVDSDIASELLDQALTAEAYGIVRASARADGQAQVSMNLDAELDTKAVIDLHMKQKERGFLIAIPLIGSDTGSRLVLETGIKKRTDIAVLRLISAQVAYSGQVNVSAEAGYNVSGEIESEVGVNVGGQTTGFTNAHPFQYSGRYGFEHSAGTAGSVDAGDILNKVGVKTSFRSEQEYLIIPVGIGFYTENGSKLRLMVDLKPERINQPLHFRAPQSESDLNSFFLNAIGGAELEAEGRVNLDSFTILAGLNASFKTFEVNLKDATGNDSIATLPVHAKVQVYTGVETENTSVKLIAEAEAKLAQGHVGGYIELKQRLNNGWSFGVLTGYEKHVEFTGVPESRFSNSINGSHSIGNSGPGDFGASPMNGSYAYNATANGSYGAEQSTILNQGEAGYRTYNAIPVSVMVQKSWENSAAINSVYGRGHAVISDRDGSFGVQRTGVGAGYSTTNRSTGTGWSVNADVYRESMPGMAPNMGISAGLGLHW
jgi:hypothetical protein